MTKITNISQAPQGLDVIAGVDPDGNNVLERVWLTPGQTRDDIEVDDKWAHAIAGKGLFAIEGVTPEKQTQTISDLNASLGDEDRQRLNLQLNELDEKLIAAESENTRLQQELTTSAARISELETSVTDLTTERDDLRSQVTALQGELEKAKTPEADPKFTGLTTRHKGAGSYSIFNAADEELVKGLTKDESDEWALKSDEDQLAYVKSIVNG